MTCTSAGDDWFRAAGSLLEAATLSFHYTRPDAPRCGYGGKRPMRGSANLERNVLANSDRKKDVMVIPTEDQPVSFSKHIKHLFREFDRDSMRSHFDLWSYGDVSRYADSILGRVTDGSMPCDQPWPDSQVAVLRRWVESGKAE